jgi:hypothetical protein
LTISPHLRLGNDALSSQAKADVVPIDKPERRKKGPKGLARTQMERKPSRLKKTPLGHCTDEQRARVAGQVCIVCGKHFNECHPAHVIPRGHPKMSQMAADDVRAIVPLCLYHHWDYDHDLLDLLPYLEPAWRDSQEWAAGAVGLATAFRVITGERPEALPESPPDTGRRSVY